MGFIGRLFLVAAILGQACFLYQQPLMIKKFDDNLAKIQTHEIWKHEAIPPVVNEYLQKVFAEKECLRFALVGLLGSSVLLLVNFCCLLFLPLFGVLLQMAILNNPLITPGEQTLIHLFGDIGLVAGLLLACNAACVSKAKCKVAATKEKKN